MLDNKMKTKVCTTSIRKNCEKPENIIKKINKNNIRV